MKRALTVGGVVFLLLGIFYINLAVYPFATTHPNFSDVERVFNKMQFPGDWQEINSSENRGIAGRACPIESESYCYHKSKTFKVKSDITRLTTEVILKATGCPVVSVKESQPTGGAAYTSFDCSIEGVSVSGEITWEDEPEIHFGVRT
jgi:hypothetical protein